MQIHWFEQTSADVPENDSWLSAAECEKLSGFRVAKRRADWRLGRWTAKSAVATFLALEPNPSVLRELEIRPLPSGAPRVYWKGCEISIAISLSHREDRAACAIASSSSAVGCDLEMVEPRSDAFITDYFSAQERVLLDAAREADRLFLVNLFWSAKESGLKAMQLGLRVDTRDLMVTIPASRLFGSFHAEWCPLQIACSSIGTLAGWYQREGNLLRTVAAGPCAVASPAPIQLRRTECVGGGSGTDRNAGGKVQSADREADKE